MSGTVAATGDTARQFACLSRYKFVAIESGVPQSLQNPLSTRFELANMAGDFDQCT
jgi:hypothetical protein